MNNKNNKNNNFDFSKNCERYVIDLIEQAIIHEDKSIKYYKYMSDMTKSNYNKQVIREIFLDKHKHKDMLIYLYEKMIDNQVDLSWKFEYPLVEKNIIRDRDRDRDCDREHNCENKKDKKDKKDKDDDKTNKKHCDYKSYSHHEDDFLEQIDISFKNELDNANFYRIIMTMFNELDVRDLILECLIDNQKHAQMLNYMYLKNII
ncbi:MAG: hypothetical protein R3Y29_02010 [bacterium]